MELELILEARYDVVKERVKNNLRFRVYRRRDNDVTCLAAISAYNNFVGVWKPLNITGGFSQEDSEAMMASAEERLHHYDWMEDQMVFEK